MKRQHSSFILLPNKGLSDPLAKEDLQIIKEAQSIPNSQIPPSTSLHEKEISQEASKEFSKEEGKVSNEHLRKKGRKTDREKIEEETKKEKNLGSQPTLKRSWLEATIGM